MVYRQMDSKQRLYHRSHLMEVEVGPVALVSVAVEARSRYLRFFFVFLDCSVPM